MDEFTWHKIKKDYDISPITSYVTLSGIISNKDPRTLMLGMNSDRTYQHTYTDDGILLTTIRYGIPGLEKAHAKLYEKKYFHYTAKITRDFLVSTVPSYRTYPECCDIEYTRFLLDAEIDIPFDKFIPRTRSNYYGLILDDFSKH